MSGFPANTWRLLSLRPVKGHAALRRFAARRGFPVIAISPWRLQYREDAETRERLRIGLSAECIVFTSPAAVHAAHRLSSLVPRTGQHWIAVGVGTASALEKHGVRPVIRPLRMDSEGLLALPELARPDSMGLITAPGGRGLIVATMHQRGTPVRRVDVYERVPLTVPDRAWRKLREETRPLAILSSSGEALEWFLAQIPMDVRDKIFAATAIVASERLEHLARQHGFHAVSRAAGPRPRQLVEAAVAAWQSQFS